MLVLAVNSGSSSLKCAIVDPDAGLVLRSAIVESLGTSDARLTLVGLKERRATNLGQCDHGTALETLLREFSEEPETWGRLGGVGHRVVHGGEAFKSSVWIDAEVESHIERCSELAPLHNPANLLGIRGVRKALPHLGHVAVFDTAFHQTLPDFAYRYAVPAHWYQQYGIRRYGFHGTSHRYVAAEAARELGRPISELNLLTAHLGNGCSIAAIEGGRCVDTTMGFTPLEGLVMGTRSGDIDPAIIFHLMHHAGETREQIETTLNKGSGLLGLSGLSHDMRTLTQKMAENDGARLAVDVFCHRLAKHLGAMRTSFSRLDAIVFTGGIGEHSALVRRMACARLQGLGVELDESKNQSGQASIHAEASQIRVLVVPTNEELMIARDTLFIIRGRASS